MKKMVVYTLDIPDDYWLRRSFDNELSELGIGYDKDIYFSTKEDAISFSRKVMMNVEEERKPFILFPQDYLKELSNKSKHFINPIISGYNIDYVTYGEPVIELENDGIRKKIRVSARMYVNVNEKEKVIHNGVEYYRDISDKVFSPWCDIGLCDSYFINIVKKEYFIFENMVNL